jgi:hypothetical protein
MKLICFSDLLVSDENHKTSDIYGLFYDTDHKDYCVV